MTSITKMKVPVLFEETLESAFPVVNPGVRPTGSSVLVQIKHSATKTAGGIALLPGAVQTENDTTQVAKVLAHGPGCYRNRDTLKLWPEGEWTKVGDFVRIPIHTQNAKSWSIEVPGKDYRVVFTLVDDLLIGGIQEDPFYPRGYL